MDYINCTPHEIVYLKTVGETVFSMVFPPSGQIVRVKSETSTVSDFGQLTTVKTIFHPEGDLPPCQENTIYIVSTLAAQFYTERKDFVSPLTDKSARRNAEGQITGVYAFQQP